MKSLFFVRGKRIKIPSTSVLICLGALFPFWSGTAAAAPQQSATDGHNAAGPSGQARQDYTGWVNPLVGTDSRYELSHGNTYPAVAVPFGMLAWTPQTRPGRWLYSYRDRVLIGIRATHQPSPWVGDYASLVVMPGVGEPLIDAARRASPFRHENERSAPHRYSVLLHSDSIRIEIAPARRGGHLRLTYPRTDSAWLLIEPSPGRAALNLIPEQRKIRISTSDNSGGVPDNFAGHYVLQFDRPWTGFSILDSLGIHPGQRSAEGERVGACIRFDARRDPVLQLRAGSSFISGEYAARHLENETGEGDFEETCERAAAEWNKVLSRIEIEGASEDQRITFYTALYHALLYPRTFYEPDENGRPVHYSPFDGRVHSGVMYTDNGFWDTFRAVHPFLGLLYPQREQEMIRGWINAYVQGGWFPKWPSPGYRNIMIGTHMEALVADAYFKGLREFDINTAYQAMVKDGTVHDLKGRNGRMGLDCYLDLGYCAADRVREASSRTLEFAYDDFCIARLARALDRDRDAGRFFDRSLNYKKLFHKPSGFMRGRLADGRWLEPFDPVTWGQPYTEGSAWHYTWSAMHDTQGLIDLFGGREAFAAKLDSLFEVPAEFRVGHYGFVIHEMREMVLCNMGQYAHGNEPVHHVIYQYAHAGQPWKTQQRVRRVLDELYGPGPDGLAGDEDNGQMSAWYLFSALGFYPVCPGHPSYVLGAPLFKRAVLRLPDGGTFEVRAPGNGPDSPYVQSVFLNGTRLDRAWISHSEIVAGGTLEIVMGKSPRMDWAADPASAPFSLSSPFWQPECGPER